VDAEKGRNLMITLNIRPCRRGLPAAAALFLMLAAGCGAPRINLFPDSTEPLREFTLEGKGKEKVVVIPLTGTISDNPKKGLFRHEPSMVQEFVSQLKAAEKDPDVRAVVLKVDSPGGTVTASDILYHEISGFKERTGAVVVAAFMKSATSGAYYLSLPADLIVAHPTTVTGSTGVIFLRPKVAGLLDKIGVGVEVSKSGSLKDMGSPFRSTTEEEERILQEMIDELARRFLGLVVLHRSLGEEALSEVATARVYLAREALDLGLVDEIGYLDDALARARTLAGLPEDGRVVVYRRRTFTDDNIYNSAALRDAGTELSLLDLGPAASFSALDPGFHYLWIPALGSP
jgi:protease-4